MNRPLSEDLSNLVNIINSFSSNKNTVISIDIPTGINADTGEVYNNDILENNKLAVSADKLLVLNYPKIGLFNLPALEYFQDYVVLKSGVNSRMVSNNFLMEITDFEKILPYRPTSSYKGTFGKLLIIGSSKEFSGAAFLAGKAAYRAGVGLVSIATTESAISLYGSYLPEAILIGCGIGKSQETMEIVKFVIDYHNKYNNQFNLIIDADGINNLAELTNHSNVTLNNTILTPHLGELANLGHQSLSNITLNDRFRLSDEILNQLTGEEVSKNKVFKNNVIIAKGQYTKIIDGLKNTFVSPFATPLLSTAGSGDVLAGLVASLSSQDVSTLNSALLGVYTHGLSAVLKKPQYGNTGLLASDIADNIPFAIKKIQDHK